MFDLTVLDFVDPRGRANRRGLAILAAALFGAEAVYAVIFPLISQRFGVGSNAASLVIHSLSLWLGIAGTSKRLHDTGRSLWWFAAFIAIWSVWTAIVAFGTVFCLGPDAIAEDLKGLMLVSALSMLAPLAAVFWLHSAPGDGGSNRYGPAPDASGFSLPHHDNGAPVTR